MDSRHASLDSRHASLDSRHASLDSRHATLDSRLSTITQTRLRANFCVSSVLTLRIDEFIKGLALSRMAPYLETYMVILKKGDFEKKNSYKRLSEEKNCMQHKKKGKKILPTRILEKNDCC